MTPPKTWTICPLCERMAETSRELTAKGCEGKHVTVTDIEPIREAMRQAGHQNCHPRECGTAGLVADLAALLPDEEQGTPDD